MIYIVLNAMAIAAATLAGLGVGVLYQTLLAQQFWASGGRFITLATALLAEAWLCAILAGALILAPPKGGVWTMTIGSAFVIWIGFVVPTQIVSYRFRAMPMLTALTDCGHWLLVMLVQAVVLRLIGLVPPPV